MANGENWSATYTCPRCDHVEVYKDIKCSNCGKGQYKLFYDPIGTQLLGSIIRCEHCHVRPDSAYKQTPNFHDGLLIHSGYCKKCGCEIAANFIKTSFPSTVRSGTCFIATAAYQDASHPRVRDFQIFRDTVLRRSTGGRHFISWYYRNGPKLASVVESIPFCRHLVVAALTPLAHAAALVSRSIPDLYRHKRSK